MTVSFSIKYIAITSLHFMYTTITFGSTMICQGETEASYIGNNARVMHLLMNSFLCLMYMYVHTCTCIYMYSCACVLSVHIKEGPKKCLLYRGCQVMESGYLTAWTLLNERVVDESELCYSRELFPLSVSVPVISGIGAH